MSSVKYLLDTHIVLWWLADSSQLGEQVKGIIKYEQVVVSVAVAWEVIIKSQLGKPDIPDGFEEVLNE